MMHAKKNTTETELSELWRWFEHKLWYTLLQYTHVRIFQYRKRYPQSLQTREQPTQTPFCKHSSRQCIIKLCCYKPTIYKVKIHPSPTRFTHANTHHYEEARSKHCPSFNDIVITTKQNDASAQTALCCPHRETIQIGCKDFSEPNKPSQQIAALVLPSLSTCSALLLSLYLSLILSTKESFARGGRTE